MVSLFEWGRVRKRDTDYGIRRSAPNAIAAIHEFKMTACISFENASYKRFFPNYLFISCKLLMHMVPAIQDVVFGMSDDRMFT